MGRSAAFHSPRVSLFVSPGQSNTPTQFSCSVSKKVSKSAVVRNRIRRRGYAAIEKVLVHIKPGQYGVFSFKKGSEKSSFKMIEKEIVFLLDKSGLSDTIVT